MVILIHSLQRAPHRYYEVEVLTYGMVRVGWCTANAPPDTVIGMSGASYAFAPDQVSRCSVSEKKPKNKYTVFQKSWAHSNSQFLLSYEYDKIVPLES